MKRIALLLALTACEKSNDLGKLQDEANTVVAHGRAEVDAYVRRTNELLEPFADDGADPLGVVVAAAAEDDLRLGRNLHARQNSAS